MNTVIWSPTPQPKPLPSVSPCAPNLLLSTRMARSFSAELLEGCNVMCGQCVPGTGLCSCLGWPWLAFTGPFFQLVKATLNGSHSLQYVNWSPQCGVPCKFAPSVSFSKSSMNMSNKTCCSIDPPVAPNWAALMADFKPETTTLSAWWCSQFFTL